MRSRYKLNYFHHFYWRFFNKWIIGNSLINFMHRPKYSAKTMDTVIMFKQAQSASKSLEEASKLELFEKDNLKKKPRK